MLWCTFTAIQPTCSKESSLSMAFATYRQMSTSWFSSGQLHSYKSLQLAWLWFIKSPNNWTASSGASVQIFLNSRTLAASLYTCLARWYNLKVVTKFKKQGKKYSVQEQMERCMIYCYQMWSWGFQRKLVRKVIQHFPIYFVSLFFQSCQYWYKNCGRWYAEG